MHPSFIHTVFFAKKGSGMSILSTLALRMVTQEGLKGCLKIYEKRNSENKAEETEDEKNTIILENIQMSRSAKRRLRKKKLKESATMICVNETATNKKEEEPEVDDRAYDLVTLASKRNTKDFLERTIMATFLLKCLQCVGFFETPAKLDGNDRFCFN